MEVEGSLPEGDAVAVIGSRRASLAGIGMARRLGAELASEGIVVVSGGAIGIDSAALEGVLSAGGLAVVVLPTGVREPLPRRNLRLFEDLVRAGGALVAEAGVSLSRSAFLRRNRLIAAFSHVVVVVEAAERSGTRATVTAARALERPVGAVPWAPDDPGGAGCLAILRSGGHVVADLADVAKLLGRRIEPRQARDRHPILHELSLARGDAALLASRRGTSVERVLAELGGLEIEGVLRREGSRWLENRP
ncbi:MAG: DNA-processing protein DprA [Deltaproteobacteria bacterium]|nr:DNA-processing protein DprA [Deltaproteobacteria bacterium]